MSVRPNVSEEYYHYSQHRWLRKSQFHLQQQVIEYRQIRDTSIAIGMKVNSE